MNTEWPCPIACGRPDCDHLAPGEAEAKLDALYDGAFDGFHNPYSDEEFAAEAKALQEHFRPLVESGDFSVGLHAEGGVRVRREEPQAQAEHGQP